MKLFLLKNQLYLLFMLAVLSKVHGQSVYYNTFGDERIYLTPVTGKYCVQFPSWADTVTQPNDSVIKHVDKNFFITTDTSILYNYDSIYTITAVYQFEDSEQLVVTNEIILKFKDEVSYSEKLELINYYNLTKLDSSTSYLLYRTTNSDLFQTAQNIFNSELVEYCHPNFFSKLHVHSPYIPSDWYFNKQWYLRNTGQNVNGFTGTAGADIKATDAWDITTGSSDIVVAVIDYGVYPDHPDLPNSRQVRLNGSYMNPGLMHPNANDPSPDVTWAKEAHGTACAGIIAATHNNEGIAGICPNCKIMPVAIEFDDPSIGGTPGNQIYGKAIDFATNNGANIISCSWGGGSSTNKIPSLKVAIQNAINNGKIVVFSIGNNASHVVNRDGFVEFPANCGVQGLISVGASDRNDHQADYSPTSDLVDIVAPSHSAFSIDISSECPNI